MACQPQVGGHFAINGILSVQLIRILMMSVIVVRLGLGIIAGDMKSGNLFMKTILSCGNGGLIAHY